MNAGLAVRGAGTHLGELEKAVHAQIENVVQIERLDFTLVEEQRDALLDHGRLAQLVQLLGQRG